MNSLKTFWLGNTPLVRAYWLYGVLGYGLLSLVSYAFIKAPYALIFWHILIASYWVFAVIGISRSAMKYAGNIIWRYCAFGAIAYGFTGYFEVLIELFKLNPMYVALHFLLIFCGYFVLSGNSKIALQTNSNLTTPPPYIQAVANKSKLKISFGTIIFIVILSIALYQNSINRTPNLKTELKPAIKTPPQSSQVQPTTNNCDVMWNGDVFLRIYNPPTNYISISIVKEGVDTSAMGALFKKLDEADKRNDTAEASNLAKMLRRDYILAEVYFPESMNSETSNKLYEANINKIKNLCLQ